MIPDMRNTIKNHDDFLMADQDPSARCAFFLIRAKPAKFPNDPRYGLTVTKKTFRLAVDRNLAKRKLRDWIRENETLMQPQYDYVFVARHAILNASRTDGRMAMKKALNYIAKHYAK